MFGTPEECKWKNCAIPAQTLGIAMPGRCGIERFGHGSVRKGAKTAMPPAAVWPRFLDAGDRGLVVEFGTTIDETINRRVLALDAELLAAAIAGIEETIPTYRSLLVLFDPCRLRRTELRRRLERILDGLGADPVVPLLRRWTIPVRYGGSHGQDLDEVAALHGMTTDDAGSHPRRRRISRLHDRLHARLRLSRGLPAAIHTSRRSAPRLATPPGSVSIGGQQAAVAPPLTIPSAWQMLGQTPVRTYDPRRVGQSFLLRTGDTVRFQPIGTHDYNRQTAAAETGEVIAAMEEISGSGERLEPSAAAVQEGAESVDQDRSQQRHGGRLRRLFDAATTPRCSTVVTSANIACGFHAGDPLVMHKTLCRSASARRCGRRPSKLPRPMGVRAAADPRRTPGRRREAPDLPDRRGPGPGAVGRYQARPRQDARLVRATSPTRMRISPMPSPTPFRASTAT